MPEKPRNIPPEDQPDEITLQMREWLKNMSPEEEARITESMGKAFEVFERLMKDPITTQLPTIDGVVFY